MFLHQTSIVFKVWAIILMSFNWNVIPNIVLVCQYFFRWIVFWTGPRLFKRRRTTWSRWVSLGGFIMVCIFCIFLELCSARKYIHWQDYVDPPGIKFPQGWGSTGKALWSGGMVMFFVTAHYDMFCSYKRSLWESPDKNLCTERF